MKRFFVEDDQNPDARRNGHVGNIENGIEELEIFAAPDGHPLGESAVYYGKIKHVDHFSVEDFSVRFV